jgi:hypothetical protein
MTEPQFIYSSRNLNRCVQVIFLSPDGTWTIDFALEPWNAGVICFKLWLGGSAVYHRYYFWRPIHIWDTGCLIGAFSLQDPDLQRDMDSCICIFVDEVFTGYNTTAQLFKTTFGSHFLCYSLFGIRLVHNYVYDPSEIIRSDHPTPEPDCGPSAAMINTTPWHEDRVNTQAES